MATILARWPKQPGELLDYDVSFADFLYLRSDTITSVGDVLTEVTDGLTIESVELVSGNTDPLISGAKVAVPNGVVKLWLSGGTDGQSYKVTVKVTTAGGREKHAEVQLNVKEI